MAIKEESPEKVALVSQVEKKSNWIIDSGCSHHITSDMNKFVDFKSKGGGIVRVAKNAICQVKGIGFITLDGLKKNLLSVGQLVDKGYHLKFTENTCIIKYKDGKVIGIGTRSRGNVF